jgi:hypothetical protein
MSGENSNESVIHYSFIHSFSHSVNFPGGERNFMYVMFVVILLYFASALQVI